jgi:hypothetical protein
MTCAARSHMHPRSGFVVAVLLMLVLVGDGSGGHHGLPAPVTLNGVGGITLGMNSTQARRLLHAPLIERPSDTSAYGYIPICGGRMAGVAVFFGPDSNISSPGSDYLLGVWFNKGARTPRGVGIGSTRKQVLAAYHGASIASASVSDRPFSDRDLILTGSPVRVRALGGQWLRPAIYFAIEGSGKVTEIGYGGRGALLGQSTDFAVYC